MALPKILSALNALLVNIVHPTQSTFKTVPLDISAQANLMRLQLVQPTSVRSANTALEAQLLLSNASLAPTKMWSVKALANLALLVPTALTLVCQPIQVAQLLSLIGTALRVHCSPRSVLLGSGLQLTRRRVLIAPMVHIAGPVPQVNTASLQPVPLAITVSLASVTSQRDSSAALVPIRQSPPTTAIT